MGRELRLVFGDEGVIGRSTSILGRELSRCSWIFGRGLKGGSVDSGNSSWDGLFNICETLWATFSIIRLDLIYQELIALKF